MEKKWLWIALFFVSGVLYFLAFGGDDTFTSLNKQNLQKKSVLVTRIIDGDTLELNDSSKVRLLGINTPEKGRFMSEEAINFIKQIEGKEVLVESKEKDKYGRYLGYVFYEEKNMNLELLREGLAHKYYYEEDKYFKLASEIEEEAMIERRGIWKDSDNLGCIRLVKLKYKEDGERCTNKEQLILENECSEIEVLIKDDATHEYLDKIPTGTFSRNFSCVFNDDGDSLFVWDNTGLLILYRY